MLASFASGRQGPEVGGLVCYRLNGCADACRADHVVVGFFIPYAKMPVWWSWFYWLNPLSYMIYGVITRYG